MTASNPLAAAPAPASAVKYSFSNADSQIEFVGAKITRKHDGSFQTFTGTVSLVDNDASKSFMTTGLEIASIKTDEEKLTGHLKSGDLLDAAKYPKATFTSTSIKAGGDKGATHTVTGNFQLHGVTKSITFPATVKTSADTVEVDAEFAINRKDSASFLLKLHIRARRG